MRVAVKTIEKKQVLLQTHISLPCWGFLFSVMEEEGSLLLLSISNGASHS
jgi:hypothetical protein